MVQGSARHGGRGRRGGHDGGGRAADAGRPDRPDRGLSAVLVRPGFYPVHDRGRVLVDVACSIAAGGVDLYDIEALRAQAQVFGPVASDTTALRALGQISDVDLYRIDARRAAARAHLWSQLPDGVPQSCYAGGIGMGATIVLRVDGTITLAHSSKEHAEGTF